MHGLLVGDAVGEEEGTAAMSDTRMGDTRMGDTRMGGTRMGDTCMSGTRMGDTRMGDTRMGEEEMAVTDVNMELLLGMVACVCSLISGDKVTSAPTTRS